MEDVAVYAYITPLKVKIVLALALSDSVVRDVEINMVSPSLLETSASIYILQIFKALHMAYYSAISNPFLKLDAHGPSHVTSSPSLVGASKWKFFKRRIDEISRAVGTTALNLASAI
jgi:hypothetical protein